MAEAGTNTPEAGPSDVAVMAQFVQAHGDSPNASPEESRRGTPPTISRKAQEEPETPPPSEPSGDEGDLDLDPETLKRLGLDDALPAEPSKGGDGDDDGATEAQIDLSRLASAIGVDEGDLSVRDGKVRVKTKVDGEIGEVSLEELRKGYQLQSHFTRQQQEFLQQKEQWEAARTKQEEQFRQQATLAIGVLQQQEKEIDKAYTLDWATLRREDPAEYAALMAEYQTRKAGVHEEQQKLAREMQQHFIQQQHKAQEQQSKILRSEANKLAEKMKWTDPEVWKSNLGKLRTYLKEDHGFSDDLINSLSDHRAYVIVEKARQFDELKKRIRTAQKRVTEEPRIVPSGGAAAPVRGGKKRQLQNAQATLAKSGRLEDAAKVFELKGFS